MAITYEEYLETKEYFDKHLLTCIELERAIPTGDKMQIAKALKTKAFNKDYDKGEFIIDHDGSVDYGHEIILSGRNFTFQSLYEKLSFFEKEIDKLKAQPVNESCSSHITFFTEFKKPFPELVIRNILQIVRANQVALYYLSGATKRQGKMCRESGIQTYAKPMFIFSPINKSLLDVINDIQKYHVVSFRDCHKVDDGNRNTLNRFFAEFREPDGIRVPSALSALVFLHKAIISKALKESLNAELHADLLCGLENWEKQKVVIQNHSQWTERDFIHSCAKDLLRYVEKEILEEKDGDVILSILKKLAEESISEKYQKLSIIEVNSELNNKINAELMNGNHIAKTTLKANQEKVLGFLLLDNSEWETMNDVYNKISEKIDVTSRHAYTIVGQLEQRMGKTLSIVEKKLIFR
jgi:hypothetical protein